MMKSALLLFAAAALASGQKTTHDGMIDSCDLECSNGGYCTLIEGTAEQLARKAQGGDLIEVCVCRPGLTGIACENILEQCSLPERKCHNGDSCSKMENGEFGCDCSLADSLSLFAGQMCRKPITEYCTGRFQPHSALSFCTNGGRCDADFIAAKVAPGDTSVNRKYQHAGCTCPAEFYGPHCEFLRSNAMEEGHDQSRSHVRTNRKIQSPATAILMTVMSAALVVLLGLIHMKRRQIRQARNSMIRDFPSVITISNENNYYHDQAAAFSDDGPVLGDSVTQTSRGSGRRQPALEFVQLA